MQAVFHLPVMPDVPGHVLGRSLERRNIVSPDRFGPVSDLPGVFSHDHGRQARPLVLFPEPVDIGADCVTAGRGTPMIAINSLNTITPAILILVLLEKAFDILVQLSLIAFQADHIIPFLFKDLLADLALAPPKKNIGRRWSPPYP